ncbi:MAG: hypothetical protein LC659_13760 [Myxococcales bacterium]|nr:hypothetical protein [Myxococcales bacterium]
MMSIALAACHNALPDDGPVGTVVARITQVPDKVGCVSITAVGSREVFHTFDVIPGQSATLQLGDLPVGNVAFSAAAYGQSCNAIAGAQPSWATTSPFVATISAGQLTSLTLTLEPTGGAVIGIDFGDGGAPPDGGPPNDLSPCYGCYDGGDGDMSPWVYDGGPIGNGDMAYPTNDLAHP